MKDFHIPSPSQNTSHHPIPRHPHDFQSPGSPTQTSLGRQCSWRQACRLAPGFPAPEGAPGERRPAAPPATLPLLYSRFATSGPTARQSPCPLPNYAAPPVLCTLDPHTTHKPGRGGKWQPVVSTRWFSHNMPQALRARIHLSRTAFSDSSLIQAEAPRYLLPT